MKQTITEYDFRRAFETLRPENFTYDGLTALFDYFEDYEQSTNDEEIELDVIAICCEYTEYENLAEFHEAYDKEDYPDIESIQDQTTVIEVENNHAIPENERAFIIQQF